MLMTSTIYGPEYAAKRNSRETGEPYRKDAQSWSLPWLRYQFREAVGMSAIADFRLIGLAKVEELKDNAVPKKKLLGAKDTYHVFLDKHSKKLKEYDWSGYIFTTLLVFLEEKGINLMESKFDELAKFLTEARNATHFIFTIEHKNKYLEKLNANHFNQAELDQYYIEFNGAGEPGAGAAMLDGIEVLAENLGRLDGENIIVVSVC